MKPIAILSSIARVLLAGLVATLAGCVGADSLGDDVLRVHGADDASVVGIYRNSDLVQNMGYRLNANHSFVSEQWTADQPHEIDHGTWSRDGDAIVLVSAVRAILPVRLLVVRAGEDRGVLPEAALVDRSRRRVPGTTSALTSWRILSGQDPAASSAALAVDRAAVSGLGVDQSSLRALSVELARRPSIPPLPTPPPEMAVRIKSATIDPEGLRSVRDWQASLPIFGEKQADSILVTVSGAVIQPGRYYLPKGASLADALAASKPTRYASGRMDVWRAGRIEEVWVRPGPSSNNAAKGMELLAKYAIDEGDSIYVQEVL